MSAASQARGEGRPPRPTLVGVSLPVVQGAMLTCSFGMAPSTLNVLPDKAALVESRPVATIMDNKPFVNIAPFGVCMSLANPITAAQTAAALGVLTPGACIPVLPAICSWPRLY